jgi:tetratricopeptide (TPR) repeat protein
VWDSVPYSERFPAIEAARKAEAKVQPIVASRLGAGESVQSIRQAALADASLPKVEQRAYMIVTTALAESAAKEAASLNDSIWPQVANPLADPSRAPDLAAKADRMLAICAHDADQLNTVGVAFVRLGRHAEAIQVLRRAEASYEKSGRGAQPGDWAFLAMAHWHLGQQAEAREALAIFRRLRDSERWQRDAEVKGWSQELDALIQ